MLNRLYFSRNLTFILRERREAFYLRANCKFSQVLKQNGQNLSLTHRSLWTSNVLNRNAGFLARCQVLNQRFYQRKSSSTAKSLSGRLWVIVRGVLLVTGGLVWLVAFTAYWALDRVTVDVLESDNRTAANALQKKLAEHFYKEKSEVGILRKERALDSIWQKLSKEDRIKELFGEPVFICGYNYKFMSDSQDLGGQVGNLENEESSEKVDDEKLDEQVEGENEENDVETAVDDSAWEAGCYIEGPKKMGFMNVKFEKHKHEWVPVSLHLQTLEKTGQVVSNVSGSLPNGIKNFTRLSN